MVIQTPPVRLKDQNGAGAKSLKRPGSDGTGDVQASRKWKGGSLWSFQNGLPLFELGEVGQEFVPGDRQTIGSAFIYLPKPGGQYEQLLDQAAGDVGVKGVDQRADLNPPPVYSSTCAPRSSIQLHK